MQEQLGWVGLVQVTHEVMAPALPWDCSQGQVGVGGASAPSSLTGLLQAPQVLVTWTSPQGCARCDRL